MRGFTVGSRGLSACFEAVAAALLDLRRGPAGGPAVGVARSAGTVTLNWAGAGAPAAAKAAAREASTFICYGMSFFFRRCLRRRLEVANSKNRLKYGKVKTSSRKVSSKWRFRDRADSRWLRLLALLFESGLVGFNGHPGKKMDI